MTLKMTIERTKRTKKKGKGHARGHPKVAQGHLKVVRDHPKVEAAQGQGHVTAGDQGQNLRRRRIKRAKRTREIDRRIDLGTDPGIDPRTERMRIPLEEIRKRRRQIG